MIRLLYTAVTSLAAPAGALYLAIRPRHRPLLARFAPRVPSLSSRPIWVHACSVGEVRAALPLLQSIAQRWPGSPIALTTSTVTGRELAESLVENVHIIWLPFDHPLIVRRFIARLKPRALALVETELWPALIWEARRSGVPVVLLNGRLSDTHYASYRRHQRFIRPIVSDLAAAGMQNQTYLDRITALGLPPSCGCITGNTKFDGAQGRPDKDALEALRQENGFAPDQLVVVFGSTRPGDEDLAAACWAALLSAFPNLKLIIAPRHPNRAREALNAFAEAALLRSQVEAGIRPTSERIFILDTVGELIDFYSIADIAVIGGSFSPGVEGHNPIEPAALGVPVVFGPHMRNFDDSAAALLLSGAAIQTDSAGLAGELRSLLSDSKRREDMSGKGRQTIEENRGAVNRNLDLLAGVIDSSPSPGDEQPASVA